MRRHGDFVPDVVRKQAERNRDLIAGADVRDEVRDGRRFLVRELPPQAVPTVDVVSQVQLHDALHRSSRIA